MAVQNLTNHKRELSISKYLSDVRTEGSPSKKREGSFNLKQNFVPTCFEPNLVQKFEIQKNKLLSVDTGFDSPRGTCPSLQDMPGHPGDPYTLNSSQEQLKGDILNFTQIRPEFPNSSETGTKKFKKFTKLKNLSVKIPILERIQDKTESPCSF